MKKKMILISVVLIGFLVAFTSNSWAQRERGGDRRGDRGDQFQKWNGSGDRHVDRGRIGARSLRNDLKRHFKRPGPQIKSKLNRRHHYRPAYRYKKFNRPWRHRPVYRHYLPGRFLRTPHHSVVKEINHYYSSTESYAEPEDEFSASAVITDSGFEFSVGVKETH